jgi:CRP-like cAMP-binding protein
MNDHPLLQRLQAIIPLSDAALHTIEQAMQTHHYKKGDYILRASQRADQLHFVVEGLTRMYHLNDGKEITTYLSCDGGFAVAYSAFIREQSSEEYIQCLEETQTISFSAETMHRFYSEIPGWDRVGRVLAEQHFLCMSDRILKLQMIPAKEKYLSFLQTEHPKIVQQTPLIHVASFLGITPESLSRIRKQIS